MIIHSTRQRMIATSHGSLAVEESRGGGMPLLLIHGNSFCRGIFRNQMQGQIAKNHRLISFELPGHGQSSNAIDPERSYTRPGLADAAVELLLATPRRMPVSETTPVLCSVSRLGSLFGGESK